MNNKLVSYLLLLKLNTKYVWKNEIDLKIEKKVSTTTAAPTTILTRTFIPLKMLKSLLMFAPHKANHDDYYGCYYCYHLYVGIYQLVFNLCTH